jgi:acetyltransferase
MQHLIAYARKEGIRQLYGEVLAENTGMLDLGRKLGFGIEPDPEDPTLRHVTLPLV